MKSTLRKLEQSHALLVRAVLVSYLGVFVALDLQDGCVLPAALALACICLLVFSGPRPSGRLAIWPFPELLIACWAASFVHHRGGGALLLTLPPLGLVGLGRVRAASVSLALAVAAVAYLAGLWSSERPDALDAMALFAGASLVGLLNAKTAPAQSGASPAEERLAGQDPEVGLLRVTSDGTLTFSPEAKALLGYRWEPEEFARHRLLQCLPEGPLSALDAADYLRRATLTGVHVEFWALRASGDRLRVRLTPLDNPDFGTDVPAREQSFALRPIGEDQVLEQKAGRGPGVGAAVVDKRDATEPPARALAARPEPRNSVDVLVVGPETQLQHELLNALEGAPIPVIVRAAGSRDEAIDALVLRRPDTVVVLSDGTEFALDVVQTLRGLQADANERECHYVALGPAPQRLAAFASRAFDDMWASLDQTAVHRALARWTSQGNSLTEPLGPRLPGEIEKALPGYLVSRRELGRSIADAIDAGNWIEVARAAHTLGGSPGFLNFELVRAACHQIESLAKLPDPDGTMLRTHAELVRQELDRATIGD